MFEILMCKRDIVLLLRILRGEKKNKNIFVFYKFIINATMLIILLKQNEG